MGAKVGLRLTALLEFRTELALRLPRGLFPQETRVEGAAAVVVKPHRLAAQQLRLLELADRLVDAGPVGVVEDQALPKEI